MPFGITWGYYLKMWGVSLLGFTLGSQLVHMKFKPMENIDITVQQEVERLRRKHGLKKPTSEEKFKELLDKDKEYIKLFNVDLPPLKNDTD